MLIKRVIETEVSRCCECPYYYEESDMGATLACCIRIRELDTNCGFDDILSIGCQGARYKIDEYCPFLVD